MNSRPYIVKRLRLLIYLREHGFIELYNRPDYKNPKYKIWAFDYTDELKSAIDEFYKIGY
jgi:ribosomal protein S8